MTPFMTVTCLPTALTLMVPTTAIAMKAFMVMASFAVSFNTFYFLNV